MGTDVVVLARFLLTGIALVLAFLAVVTWNRRKDAREAGTFALLVGAMAIYAFGYSGEIVQTTVAGATRWLNFEYLVLPWTPALWLLAACQHNGIRVRAPLVFVIPAFVFVGHITNFHHLFYSAPLTIVQRGPFWVLQMPRGPISVLDDAFLVVAFLTGAGIYLAGLRHASSLFRKQAFILLLSSLLPFVGDMMYLAGLTPWGLDITPITLSVTCVFVYYGIFHCGIFDLAPLARNLIFNSIRDAVLVLDTQDRLLDFNPAARALLPVLDKSSLGGDVEELFAGTVGLATVLSKTGDPIEFSMGQEPDSPSYQIRTWPLASASGQLGRAVIFADITAQVRLREELRRRAETDPLTDVANRRRFQHALEVECMRYTRGHAPAFGAHDRPGFLQGCERSVWASHRRPGFARRRPDSARLPSQDGPFSPVWRRRICRIAPRNPL